MRPVRVTKRAVITRIDGDSLVNTGSPVSAAGQGLPMPGPTHCRSRKPSCLLHLAHGLSPLGASCCGHNTQSHKAWGPCLGGGGGFQSTGHRPLERRVLALCF